MEDEYQLSTVTISPYLKGVIKMEESNQDILSLQGVTPFVSFVKHGKKKPSHTTNNNYSLICWNTIKSIFHI